VASVIRVDNEDAAIAAANDSVFGLGGGVITGDIARGERVAAEIDSGNVFVNGNVRSIRGYRSAVSSKAVMVASFRTTASRSSSISRRSWWTEREAS
jgi:acyl-CoA reductase-like NAD-dependent aldehyde dehydrogenase